MKKLNLIFAVIIVVLMISSCEDSNAPLVQDTETKTNESFILHPVTPNPVVGRTYMINMEVLNNSEAIIVFENSSGKTVMEVYKGYLNLGVHTFQCSIEELKSGQYKVKVMMGGYTETTKLIVEK